MIIGSMNQSTNGVLNAGGWQLMSELFIDNLITNGNVETWSAGASAAPDGWTKYGASSTIEREATIIKIGTYSAKLTRSGTNAYLTQDVKAGMGIGYWQGKTVTFGAWVYATEASRVQLFFDDGVATHTSSYHTGDSTWQWLTISDTVNASATILEFSLRVITGDTSGYIDGAIAREASSISSTTDTSNWELTSYTFSGLNGNVDEEYRLVSRFVAPAESYYRIQLNGDTGNNYGYQRLYGAATTTGAVRNVGDSFNFIGYGGTANDKAFSDTIIYAKSGYVRTAITKTANEIATTTVGSVQLMGFSWNNTADNVTSLTVVGATNCLGVGTHLFLFKRNLLGVDATSGIPTGDLSVKGDLTAGEFQKIYDWTSSGSFTNLGIDTLDGNTDILYELVLRQVCGVAGTSEAGFRPNNDSGATNYGYQSLYGADTAVGAGRSTYSTFFGGYATGVGHISMARILMYAKSGYVRTALIETSDDIATNAVGVVELWGQSWNNTADNITSITLRSNLEDGFGAGTHIELWALRKKV